MRAACPGHPFSERPAGRDVWCQSRLRRRANCWLGFFLALLLLSLRESPPNKHLQPQLSLSGKPLCISCLFLLQSLAGGSLGYQWGGGAQGVQISSPVSTPVTDLAFEEFGLRPGVSAYCFGDLRGSLKVFLAVGILCNENPF